MNLVLMGFALVLVISLNILLIFWSYKRILRQVHSYAKRHGPFAKTKFDRLLNFIYFRLYNKKLFYPKKYFQERNYHDISTSSIYKIKFCDMWYDQEKNFSFASVSKKNIRNK